MKIFIFFIVLLAGCSIHAQTNAILGVVIDSDSKLPLGNCNVFISNTSKGQVTDSSGKFLIYNIPEGKSLDLVVSSVGYETFTYSFSSARLPLNLKISLNKRIVEMENIVIVPVEADGWEKWGRLFINAFIGESENAAECEIENIGIIKFRKYKAENILEATADGIIIIKNYRLGYIIKYQLEKFTYDFKNQRVTYLGYPLYEEMYPSNEIMPKFFRRRSKAYNGSFMHFMRSVYTNRLAAEGFEVQRMQRIIVHDTLHGSALRNIMFVDHNGNKMKPPPYVVRPHIHDLTDSSLLTADSVLFKGVDSIKDVMAFENYLSIRYLNEREPEEYARSTHQQRVHNYQLTKITIVNEDREIFIEPHGNYYPVLDLFMEGYMGWEKIGDQLPLDYIPEPKNK